MAFLVVCICALLGALAGLISLNLSILPGMVNHFYLAHSNFLGVSYNERLPLTVFVGVSLQGMILAWLLAHSIRVLGRTRYSGGWLWATVFAVVLPSPAILYPALPSFHSQLAGTYSWIIGGLATVWALRVGKRHGYFGA